jgi:hypothetical protein
MGKGIACSQGVTDSVFSPILQNSSRAAKAIFIDGKYYVGRPKGTAIV